ncbi:MAG TPA: sulfite exporter TauE/SafE family protein [Acidimicrobiales bacterium]
MRPRPFGPSSRGSSARAPCCSRSLFIAKRLEHVHPTHPGRRWFLYAGIFLVAVYGGYFGAGLGILLLAVMAIALPFELARLQGLRAVLSTLINFAAAIVFLVRGHLVVWAVVTLLVGTVTGGWIETWLIQRLSPRVVRGLVVVIAVATPIRLA